MTYAIVVYELVFWALFFIFIQTVGLFSKSEGERMEFLNPEFFWWFLLIPFVIFLFYRKIFQRNKWLNSLKDKNVAGSFLRPVSHRRCFLRFFLIRNAIAFLVIALMQPAFGSSSVKGKASGVEIVFAVDLSNSMNVRDMSRNSSRLEAAKKAMNQFINTATAAKTGLLVFAGSVYPQLPLTADKVAAKMYVENLSTDLISNQGTNIGLALERSADFFTRNDFKKYIVLITDGEDHEGGVQQALELLKEKEISLLILALGTEKGGLVPLVTGNKNTGYIKDDLGSSVVSKLNKEMITDLADKSAAPFVVSDDAFPVISTLLTHVNTSKATKDVDLEFEIKANRYYVPLFMALICLLTLVLGDFFPILSGKFKEE